MTRLFHLATCLATLFGLSATTNANDYLYAAQREQIHQQYLSPMEHQALHQGMNGAYGTSYSSYPTANSLPYSNLPYGSSYGYGNSYGVGYGASPVYGNSYGIQPYNYGRSRMNCGTSQCGSPAFNGWRLW